MTIKARIAAILPPLLPLVFCIGFVEIAVRLAWVPSYLIPAPSEVFRSVIDDRTELGLAAWETLSSALVGLLLSFAAGTLFSVALSSSDLARRAFYPYAVFFQTVPIISIAPLLVIWFGFGRPTVIASAAIVSVFPTLAREGVDVSAGWQLDKKIGYDSAGLSVRQITLDHTHYDTIDGCRAATELYGSVFRPTVHEEIYAFEDLPRCMQEMHENVQTGIPIVRVAKEMPKAVDRLLR